MAKSEYERLREEFERKVTQLQKGCSHKVLSEWTEEWWAPAHSTGYEVKVCRRCNKVVKRRSLIAEKKGFPTSGPIAETYAASSSEARSFRPI